MKNRTSGSMYNIHFLFLQIFLIFSSFSFGQVDCTPIICATPLTPPAVIDGVSVTDSFTGGVTTYPVEFVSCSDTIIRTTADCKYIGTTVFTYTLHFS